MQMTHLFIAIKFLFWLNLIVWKVFSTTCYLVIKWQGNMLINAAAMLNHIQTEI